MRQISRLQGSFLYIRTSALTAAPASRPVQSKRSIATKTCPISGSITFKSTPIIIADSPSVVPDAGRDPDFEHLAGAVDDGAHRVVGHAESQRRGFRKAFREALQLRAAAGKAHAGFDHFARGFQR